MTARSFLDNWNVKTVVPTKLLERAAVRYWALEVERTAQLSPGKVDLAYFRDLAKNCSDGAYSRWRNDGYPTPPLISKDGKKGALLTIEAHYPGSLRHILHPGWVLLSGPSSLAACLGLMDLLDNNVTDILRIRCHKVTPDWPAELGSGRQFTSPMSGGFFVDPYIQALRKIGSLDAFFGVVGLQVEQVLETRKSLMCTPYFHFDPSKWAFCRDLPLKIQDQLALACESLRTAYAQGFKPEKLESAVAFDTTQYFKCNQELVREWKLEETVQRALAPGSVA